jgi:hypothetical protein
MSQAKKLVSALDASAESIEIKMDSLTSDFARLRQALGLSEENPGAEDHFSGSYYSFF